MSTPLHPDWVAPPPTPPSPVAPPPAETPKPSTSPTSRTTRSTAQTRAMVAAEGTVIPIPYGRLQLGAKVFAQATDPTSRLTLLGCIWGLGEFEEIETVRDGDSDLTDRNDYLGTLSQAPDPWLVDAIEGYDDDLIWRSGAGDIGIAYSVIKVNTTSSAPRPVATVKAKKVYDPDLDDVVYSDAPALAYADMLSSPIYGEARVMDWDSVQVVRLLNAQEMADGSPRRTIGLSVDRVASATDWRKTMELYAGCWAVSAEDFKVKLVADAPGIPQYTFDESIIVEGSLSLKKRGRADAPTVVTVNYTQTVDSDGAELREWRDAPATVKAPGVDDGDKVWRETRIGLTGITNPSQAIREATEHLNRYLLTDLDIEFIAMDEAIDVVAGQLVNFEHPILGTVVKVMRVESISSSSAGRWRVKLYEHDNAIYSDTIQTQPGYEDTDLPSPFNPPSPPAVSVVEEIFQLRTGIYASRLRVLWTEANFAYVLSYRISVQGGIDPDTGEQTPDALAWQADTRGLPTGVPGERYAVTSQVQEGAVLTVSVATLSTTGVTSDPATVQITPQGKYLIPGNVPEIYAVQTQADYVQLTWLAAFDIDIWQYEIRTGADWDTGTVVDRTDGLSLLVGPLEPGAHLFWVKAIDSVNQYSALAAGTSITLNPPPPVTGFTGYEVGGEIHLAWNESPSQYVRRYELRWGDVGLTWNQAKPLDIIDALTYVSSALPQGTWTLFIKSVDSAGLRSDHATTIDLTVTLDASSFLLNAFRIERAYSTENMAEYWFRPEGYGSVLEDVFHEEFYAGTFDGWAKGGVWTAEPGKIICELPQATNAWITSLTKIPYDPTLQYQIEVVFSCPVSADDANCAVRLGYTGFDADGNYCDVNGGTAGPGSGAQHWHAYYSSGDKPATRTTVVRHTIGQSTPGDNVPVDPAAACHPNVTHLSPAALLSLGTSCTGLRIEIESFRVRVRAPDVMHYLTDMGETPAALWPLTMDNYPNILGTYHADGDSDWLSATFDAGLVVTGDWTVQMGWEELSPTVVAQLELSEDGAAWDAYPELSAKTAARYARLRISGTLSATAHVFSTEGVLRINAQPKVENGTGTTDPSGKASITLQNSYAAVKSVQATPFGQPYPMSAVIDNIDNTGVATSFDVWVFNQADGLPLPGVSFTYTFEGV